MNFKNSYLITEVHTKTKIAPAELLFNRKIRGFLPDIVSTKVVDKQKLVHDNIITRKDKNRKYHDTCQKVKESDINVGDVVICKQRKTNKSYTLI